MRKQRNILIALISALLLTNVTVVLATTYTTKDVTSEDYPGDTKGYASALIVESSWGRHRGRSYVALMGGDAQFMTNCYEADSTIGNLCELGGISSFKEIRLSDECTKHGYFSSVETRLDTETSEISVKVKD